eukprot:CAMPEP_0198293244 /NCGR_PEP_ID=MMETSP1449-20131203/16144_1 /TAXON_ID=420275 /ORGANISM="Attheya septentrionalis, Strain CCMP2084" /LENGTH=475 /DNA_ID=CAMNT_0043992759 /DNA_START=207 /DNA_END=1630 /DNA_ORIENTATION=-
MKSYHVCASALLLLPSIGVYSFSSSSSKNAHPRNGKGLLHMSVPGPLDTLTSGLASIVRLPKGVTVSGVTNDIKTPGPRLVELYDVENDVECRKVRERISELDLMVERVIPATENSRARTDPNSDFHLPEIGMSVPRLVIQDDLIVEEDNQFMKGQVFVGAEDIIQYLNQKFGSDEKVMNDDVDDIKEKALVLWDQVGGYLALLLRVGRGTSVCSAASATLSSVPRPEKPLVLYSYEGNQFCRLVREVLTELDIVYELRSAGKQSPRREELASISGGSSQCPYLMDPNTNTDMRESADIIRYLYKTYALWTPPSELLGTVSNIITPILKPVYEKLAPLQAGSYQEDKSQYELELAKAKSQVEAEITSAPVVVYTYKLSPFCTEATELLDNLGVSYKEISLGLEWIPGLIAEGGSAKRAALGDMTGQTSLPHFFVEGKSIGGLYSGNPGLVPSLEQGTFPTSTLEGANTDTLITSV